MVLRRWVGCALACSITACGGDTDEGSTSSTGGPAGALNLEVYATDAQSCPPGNIHVVIGNPKTSPPELVTDAEDGATVNCSVLPQAGGYAARGELARGGQEFSFGGIVTTSAASAAGSASFADPADGTVYASPADKPCIFEFVASAGNGVEAGRLSATFACSELVSQTDGAKSCSARYGALLVQGCEGALSER
jgi:hypothetical protein